MYQNLIQILIDVGIKLDWQNKYAKWNHQHTKDQSLLIHSINQASIFLEFFKLDAFNAKISEIEKIASIISSFFSDIGKSDDEFQNAVNNNSSHKESYNHVNKSILNQVEEILDMLKPKIKKSFPNLFQEDGSEWEELIFLVKNGICYHEVPNFGRVLNDCQGLKGPQRVAHLVNFVDSLVSNKKISSVFHTINRNQMIQQFIKDVHFTYHEISKFRGILSLILSEALIELHKQANYFPLLSFANGVIYYSENPEKIQFANLQDIVLKKCKKIIANPEYFDNIYNAIYGSVTTTPVLEPCLLNEGLIRRKLEEGYAVKESDLKKEIIAFQKEIEKAKGSSENLGPYLIEQTELFDINQNVLIKKYKRWRSPLVFWGSLLKEIKQWDSSINSTGLISALFGIDESLIDSGYSNGAKRLPKIKMMVELWKSYIQSRPKQDHFQLIEQGDFNDLFQEWLIENTIAFFKKHETPPLIDEEIFDILDTDIIYPNFSAMNSKKKEFCKTMKDMLDSKGEKKYLCSFCNFPTNETALEGLIGKGPRSFSNKLPGGVGFGDKYSAKVCSACRFESLLRNIMMGDVPNSYILIYPELNMTPAVKHQWKNKIEVFINEKMKSINILNHKTLAKAIEKIAIENLSYVSENTLLENRLVSKDKKKQIKKGLESWIQEKFDNFEDFLDLWGKSIKIKVDNTTELVDAILNNHVDDRELLSHIPQKSTVTYSYSTPDYVLIFFRYEIGNKEDSASIKYLRKLWFGILLSQLFFSRIKLINSLNHVELTESQTLVDIPKPGLFAKICQELFSTMGVNNRSNEIVTISNRMTIFRKISKLLALESMDPDSEQGFVLKMFNKSRGYILNYFFQNENRRKRINDVLTVLGE
ncbi:MAG: type I-D CRISPR-associated protein Cas10d/Csc3 [Candidatus Lokiarchaeota archaeon]|nr:type I-D CRISPR-associated protein Cas10d/Csc3 [Candidatus Lokiarchaeota archaeon]